jgi:hypothetical protein
MVATMPSNAAWLSREARKRERVQCSSLVDWPVYPRLTRTMRASTPPARKRSGRTLRGSREAPDGLTAQHELTVLEVHWKIGASKRGTPVHG